MIVKGRNIFSGEIYFVCHSILNFYIHKSPRFYILSIQDSKISTNKMVFLEVVRYLLKQGLSYPILVG